MPIDFLTLFAEEVAAAHERIEHLAPPDMKSGLNLQTSQVIMLTLQVGIQALHDELQLQLQVHRNERPLPRLLYQEYLRARREQEAQLDGDE